MSNDAQQKPLVFFFFAQTSSRGLLCGTMAAVNGAIDLSVILARANAACPNDGYTGSAIGFTISRLDRETDGASSEALYGAAEASNVGKRDARPRFTAAWKKAIRKCWP